MQKLSDYSYELPPTLIAQEPARPRDHSRLMLIDRKTDTISHHFFYDLPQILPTGYFVVANNTKVFPARIMGHKLSGGHVEILLTTPLGHSQYRCITRPGLQSGTKVIFANNLTGTITRASKQEIERVITFSQDEVSLRSTLSTIGQMPTPPYIKKMLKNNTDYQTIYAKNGFSAAAPTAGLHFTPSLLSHLKSLCPWYELTLNVGLGTFLPVKAQDIKAHHMHQESYTLLKATASGIMKERESGRKLLAIGTTTTRALESNPACQAGKRKTEIYIYPPYRFQLTDALLTNFHLPGSTLLMMVSAFMSFPNTQQKFTNFQDSLLGQAYREAVRTQYRFFSFGDAMLIL